MLFKHEFDKEMVKAINNSDESLNVIGRGTVVISAKRVAETIEFRDALERAARLVESSYLTNKVINVGKTAGSRAGKNIASRIRLNRKVQSASK
jgi:hypothetical protein